MPQILSRLTDLPAPVDPNDAARLADVGEGGGGIPVLDYDPLNADQDGVIVSGTLTGDGTTPVVPATPFFVPEVGADDYYIEDPTGSTYGWYVQKVSDDWVLGDFASSTQWTKIGGTVEGSYTPDGPSNTGTATIALASLPKTTGKLVIVDNGVNPAVLWINDGDDTTPDWNLVVVPALLEQSASFATQANIQLKNVEGSTTNSALVLTPKGTGALIRGPRPDGTTTGGNARGAGATDLNGGPRTAANQVASGPNAFAAGTRALASGGAAISLGEAPIASGGNAFAAGVNSEATGTETIAMIRGRAYAAHAIALGRLCYAQHQSGFSTGQYTGTNHEFERVHGSHFGFALGTLQFGDTPLGIATTNATPAVLTCAAGAGRALLRNWQTWHFEVSVIARQQGANDCASFVRRGIIKRDANAASTALVGTVQTVGTDMGSNGGAPPTGWDVAVTADTTNGALSVTVTGAAATNIRWSAHLKTTQTLYQ